MMSATKKFLLWFIFILILAWLIARILNLEEIRNSEKLKFDIGTTKTIIIRPLG
jgi:hypothetical protein